MHAAAPWQVHHAGKHLVWVVNQHRCVATVPVVYEPTDADLREAQATARLISSAPDLLHAAKAVLSKHQDATRLLQHSVAKATGEA